MSLKPNPTIIGAFTLIGLLLAGTAVVLFGAGRLFKKTHSVLLYFDKSVYGLQVGSDVRFGGVRIGSVRSISVLVDTANDRKIIPVVIELGERELGQIGVEKQGGIDFSTHEGVRKAVEKGLRAGMKQQSLVTGQLYIEFDIDPSTPGFVYHSRQTPDYPVVPTIGTEMDEMISGIADGIRKFNALDLESVINELNSLLANADRQVRALDTEEINANVIAITEDIRKLTADEKLPAAIASLNRTLAEIEQIAGKANQGIDPLLADLAAVIESTEAGLARIEQAAREISSLSNPRGPILLRMQNVLQETERASRALKELSNDLKRDPKAILTGKANPE
jgi:paraquat-inducible protein B